MRWCWIIIALLLFLSCRSKKETVSGSIDEHYIEKIEKFIEKRDSMISVKNSLYWLSENIEIIEREFDTDHEPDSAGNYPIKKETITKIDKDGKAEITEKDNSGSNTNAGVKKDSKTDKTEEIKTTDETKENASFKYLIIFGILVVVTVIIVFLRQLGVFRNKS